METAILALGSFWEPEDYFGRLDGVTKIVVGYTGGSSKNPTFHNIGDHSEAIKIDFDQHKISFEELLEQFWKQHDPTAQYELQFKSAIFYLDDLQHTIATESLKDEQEKFEEPIMTEILPAGMFYEAESYHQHYLAKLRGEL